MFTLKSGHICCINIWNFRGLQKKPLIRKKTQLLANFCSYFDPSNYVSKTLWGNGFVAPKLLIAKVKGSKNLRCKDWRKFARRVLDPSTFSPRSSGAMKFLPAKFWRHNFRGKNNQNFFTFLILWVLFQTSDIS